MRKRKYKGCKDKYNFTLHGKIVEWTDGDYSIDTLGQAWSFKYDKPRKLTAYKTANGYLTYSFMINGKRITPTAHSLVAEAFIGARPEGCQIRHLDGIKINSKLSNLKYGTPSENYKDVVDQGRKIKKLNAEEVKEILFLLENTKIKQVEIAKKFNISSSTVSDIKNKRSWHCLN